MLPRLIAEESIAASNRVAIGSGTADADAAKAVTKEWTRTACPNNARPQKATPQALGGMGIGVRRVRREPLAP